MAYTPPKRSYKLTGDELVCVVLIFDVPFLCFGAWMRLGEGGLAARDSLVLRATAAVMSVKFVTCLALAVIRRDATRTAANNGTLAASA